MEDLLAHNRCTCRSTDQMTHSDDVYEEGNEPYLDLFEYFMDGCDADCIDIEAGDGTWIISIHSHCVDEDVDMESFGFKLEEYDGVDFYFNRWYVLEKSLEELEDTYVQILKKKFKDYEDFKTLREAVTSMVYDGGLIKTTGSWNDVFRVNRTYFKYVSGWCDEVLINTFKRIMSVRKIQRQLKQSMYNPEYKMCREIMRKKFETV